MGVAAGAEGVVIDAGDAELTAFCRREYRRLVGTIGLYINDVAAAEDLAQEALLRACRRWDEVRGLESPGGWVHRVAMNLAISWSRRRRTADRTVEQLFGEAQAPSVPPDPTDALAIRAAVAALPDRQREALVLRYFADLPVADVAEAMACPEGTVKTLTSRAIAALRAAGWEVEE